MSQVNQLKRKRSEEEETSHKKAKNDAKLEYAPLEQLTEPLEESASQVESIQATPEPVKVESIQAIPEPVETESLEAIPEPLSAESLQAIPEPVETESIQAISEPDGASIQSIPVGASVEAETQ